MKQYLELILLQSYTNSIYVIILLEQRYVCYKYVHIDFVIKPHFDNDVFKHKLFRLTYCIHHGIPISYRTKHYLVDNLILK